MEAVDYKFILDTLHSAYTAASKIVACAQVLSGQVLDETDDTKIWCLGPLTGLADSCQQIKAVNDSLPKILAKMNGMPKDTVLNNVDKWFAGLELPKDIAEKGLAAIHWFIEAYSSATPKTIPPPTSGNISSKIIDEINKLGE